MDVVLAVDALIDEFGRDSLGCEIPPYEADERRVFEEEKEQQRRRDEYLREKHKQKRPPRVYGKKGQLLKSPHEDWVPIVGRIVIGEASPQKRKAGKRSKPKKVDDESLHTSQVAYWGPPDLADDTGPDEWGLIAKTHRQRCVLLLAVQRRFAIWKDDTFDPEEVSFQYENERGRGYGHYAILVHMADQLTDADAPVLMRMVEKVRKEFAERSGGQQGETVETSENVENDKRVPVAQSERVKLHAPDEEPEIDGLPVPKLPAAQYDVIKALLEAGRLGLGKDDLDNKSGHTEARKRLKATAEKSAAWKDVIVFPGTTGRKYRVL